MAVLADGGKNFGRNPTLEALGRFELGAEDQSVEARLVDAVDRLSTTELVGDFLLDEVFRIDVLGATFGFLYPRAVATSIATNRGSSGVPSVRTEVFSNENMVIADIEVSFECN